MKTVANKKYALSDTLTCSHYPLMSKESHKCVACEELEFKDLTSSRSPIENFHELDEVGGFLISGPASADTVADVLSMHYGKERVRREVRLGASRMRADILLDGRHVIEFDGPSHYTNARTIASDVRKNKLCDELGGTIIRIPFWIQLDRYTANMYKITDKLKIHSSFPHGWITCDVFPASFCEAGVDRFYTEFSKLPHCLKHVVFHNLQECFEGRAREEVLTARQFEHLSKIIEKSDIEHAELLAKLSIEEYEYET